MIWWEELHDSNPWLDPSIPCLPACFVYISPFLPHTYLSSTFRYLFRAYSPSTTPCFLSLSVHSLNPYHPLLFYTSFSQFLSSLYPSFHPKPPPLSPPHWTLFSANQYSIHSCHPIRPPLYSSHIIFSTPLPPSSLRPFTSITPSLDLHI